MMMNCMNTGTGGLAIAGIRLADAALAMTTLVLAVLAMIAVVTAVRFCIDVVRRFNTHSPSGARADP